ncbi:hypothetical protein D3C72_1528730 [compost metagenome]
MPFKKALSGLRARLKASPKMRPTNSPALPNPSSVSLENLSGSSRSPNQPDSALTPVPMPSISGANGLKASKTGASPVMMPCHRPLKNALMGCQNLMMAIPSAARAANGARSAPIAPNMPPKVTPSTPKMSFMMARGPSRVATASDSPPMAMAMTEVTAATRTKVLASSGFSSTQ